MTDNQQYPVTRADMSHVIDAVCGTYNLTDESEKRLKDAVNRIEGFLQSSRGTGNFLECYSGNDERGFPTATYRVPEGSDIQHAEESAMVDFYDVVVSGEPNGKSIQDIPAEWNEPILPEDEGERR